MVMETGSWATGTLLSRRSTLLTIAAGSSNLRYVSVKLEFPMDAV